MNAIAGVFSNTTVPDDLGTAETDFPPAPELSPTASTVGRRRTILTFMPGSTRARLAAFVGGALAALAAVIVFIVMGRSGDRPAPIVAAPPEAVPLAAPLVATPIATIAASATGATIAPGATTDPATVTPADSAIPTTSVVALPTAPARLGAPTAAPVKPPVAVARPRVTRPAPASTPKPAPVAPAAKPAPQDEVKKTLEIWK